MELKVLQVVKELPGVTAKVIGEKLRVSAYSALVYARSLVNRNEIRCKEVLLRTGGQTVYLFYPLIKD